MDEWTCSFASHAAGPRRRRIHADRRHGSQRTLRNVTRAPRAADEIPCRAADYYHSPPTNDADQGIHVKKNSAGILMYRIVDGELQVLLAHPGGPFWSRRDDGAWTIPKGEIDPDESAEAAARREFREETG